MRRVPFATGATSAKTPSTCPTLAAAAAAAAEGNEEKWGVEAEEYNMTQCGLGEKIKPVQLKPDP